VAKKFACDQPFRYEKFGNRKYKFAQVFFFMYKVRIEHNI